MWSAAYLRSGAKYTLALAGVSFRVEIPVHGRPTMCPVNGEVIRMDYLRRKRTTELNGGASFKKHRHHIKVGKDAEEEDYFNHDNFIMKLWLSITS